MRNLDSVLFEIGAEAGTGVAIEPASTRTAAAGRRVAAELGLLGWAMVKLTVVAGITLGLAWLYRQLHSLELLAAYTEAAFVPLFGAICAALWTTGMRLAIEPRRVSAPTLLLIAGSAYPAAWLLRAYLVGATAPSLEWMLATKHADLGSLSKLTLPIVGAELLLTVVFGLCWARWFLGPPKQS